MDRLKLNAANEGKTWANLADEERPMPTGDAASYKSETYLPEADDWVKKQEENNREASNARSSLGSSNLENINRNKRSYNRYLEREGLPRRASRTPPRPRRYGIGRSYVPAGTRRRSPSPRRSRRSPSPRRSRRSPSPRRSRRSPSPRRRAYVPARSPSPRRSRRPSVSPLRYTVTNTGEMVNEFGRVLPKRNTRRHR